MRLFRILVFLFYFSMPSWAYGKRGAAERALFFMVYLQEEIYTDPNQFNVAPDCTGTRTGLRGQTGRCTLAQLVEYLWKADSDKPTITRPNPALTQWPGGARNNNMNRGDINPANWINWIFTNVRVRDAPGSPLHTLPGRGFCGNIEAPLLIPKTPGCVSCGPHNYYSALSDIGRLSQAAEAEFVKIQGSLSNGDRNKFQAAADKTKDIVNICYELRVKDKWDALWDPNKGDAHKVLGFTPEKVPVAPTPAYAGSVGSGWLEMDTKATIQKLMTKNNWSWPRAAAEFYYKWGPIRLGKTWRNHASAIAATTKAAKKIC